jgi:ferredoxin
MLSKLELLAAAGAALDRRGLAVRKDQCLRVRHRKSDCSRCASVCPTEAIALADDLAVSAELCSGCGACAAACPAGALVATEPSDDALRLQIARHVDNSGTVAFACAAYLETRADDRPKVVAVPCIARLDESILVAAVLAGASDVVLVDAACGRCPQAALRACVETMVDDTRQLLSHWSRPVAIRLGALSKASKPLPAAGNGGISRRGLFAAFRRSVADPGAAPSVAPAATPVQQDGRSMPLSFDGRPKAAPERLRRLIEDLRRLGAPAKAAPVTRAPWGDVSVSAGCNGCGICAGVCPTGALAVDEQDGRWSLSLRAADCNRCGLCAQLCMAQALTLADAASMAIVLEPTPRVLVTRGQDVVDELTAPVDKRFARMFGCQVTS